MRCSEMWRIFSRSKYSSCVDFLHSRKSSKGLMALIDPKKSDLRSLDEPDRGISQAIECSFNCQPRFIRSMLADIEVEALQQLILDLV